MTSRDGRGAGTAVSVYQRTLAWAERTRVPFTGGSPRKVRMRLAGQEARPRSRTPRPRLRSRARTGGAASAVVLVMIGTGTVGAFPLVTVHGRPVDTAATVTSPSASPPGTAPETGALTAGPAGLVADRADLDQGSAEFTTALPDQRAQTAIRTAMAQLGLPYVWGGDGPTNGDAGFDCSGLTTFSYAAAGVALPRTAHTQYYAGPHVPQGAPLQPGDLVFYGTSARVHHVGMYLGDGTMVNAPTFGKPVQTAFYRWNGDDYLGATRPAATGSTTGGLLPYVPPAAAAPSTGTPDVFPAPPAPAPTTTPQATAPQPAEAVSAAGAAAAAGAPLTSTETTPATATDTSTPTATTSSSAATTTSHPPSTATTGTSTTRATTAAPSTTKASAPAPPSTTAPASTTAPSSSESPSSTSAPVSTTAPSSTTASTATTAPSSTTAPPPSSTTSPPADDTVAVSLPGGVASLPTVAASGGVPVRVGVATLGGTTVLRVPAVMVGDVGVGSRITVAGTTHTVTSIVTAAHDVDDQVTAAPAGAVVVLTPAADGWTVITAT